MPLALLDIIDSNLQLWQGDTHVQSPGYALLAGGQYRFGNPARAAARLQPREINTRFWWQLGTEPLQPTLGPARHTGDLVHAHLQELHRESGQPAEVLLAVPGSMQRDQLALLLGIIQQCPFDAVGLVNRSAVLGSLYCGGERLFHLEIQLHQAVVSELVRQGAEVAVGRVQPLPGCGLLQLQEKLVEIVAAGFIRQTRFDPRRKAATEQQLYDALPAALRTLVRDGEADIEISGYRCRVSAGELQGVGERLVENVARATGAAGGGESLIADPVAGLLPGLRARLPGVQVLAGESVRRGLEQHGERLVQRGQALSFVTALPALAEAASAAAAPAPASPRAAAAPDLPRATHLLQGHLARPLAAGGTPLTAGWELVASDSGWELRGGGGEVLVNGKPGRPGQQLGGGDRLRLDGEDFSLIEVTPGAVPGE